MRDYCAVIILLVLGAFFLTIAGGLTFGTPIKADMDNYFIRHGQEQVATNNIVTTVVFDYRGFDTLGESTVLFTAVIGVALIFRKLHGGENDENE